MVTKTEDVTNSTITMYQYDKYGNAVKTTTEVTKDGETTLSVSDSTYDILGNVVSTKSGESETIYTYDAAGRTLLVNADGMYRRTVYDDHGRTVQEIEDADYNSELDNLPNAYSDTNVGQRYIYDNAGNLIQEINRFDLATDYIYSDDGLLYTKHFDIYDYYYNNKGNCEKVDVNGKTIVDYDYKVTDSDIKTEYNQYINRVTYADGYVEEQKVDKDGNVLAKYADGSEYYSIRSANEEKIVYYDKEIDRYNNISLTENKYSFVQKKSNNTYTLFDYKSLTENDKTTVSETHFGKSYKTVSDKDSIEYTSSAKTFAYSITGDEDSNTAAEAITSGENNILSAAYTYDEDNSVYQKSYGNDEFVFSTVYDDGNIVEDENNYYTYDEYGELIETYGLVNASYIYDDRGNMLTKTVDGEMTEFSYDNPEWQDQLTAVNGIDLVYDENGNLQLYDGNYYTWSHGKRLESITDGENDYTYTYNSDGIRTSKTVNGITTDFDVMGSKILAQKNEDVEIYFQYSGDKPIGFILNGRQYFYITNLSGDVVGIADASGNVLAGYVYDEWGKLLEITAAGNSVLYKKLAELNPLRYRGYYYDNETGYYYLQSRYYDPEIGRFISADGFSYINNNKPLNTNAYVYCSNSPIVYVDPAGTKQEHGWVSDAGMAVSKIIGTILVSAAALAEYGEDFMYYVAGVLVNNSELLFKKTTLWFKELQNGFKDLVNSNNVNKAIAPGYSGFYDKLKSYDKNIFKEFFEESVKTGVSYLKKQINKMDTIIIFYNDDVGTFFKGLMKKAIAGIANIHTIVVEKFNRFVSELTIFAENNISNTVLHLSYWDAIQTNHMYIGINQQVDYTVSNALGFAVTTTFAFIASLSAFLRYLAGLKGMGGGLVTI